MRKYWLNVNFQTKICTLHTDDCPFIKNLKETKFIGVGRLKLHGGWLQFNSIDEAEKYFLSNLKDRKWILRRCLVCMKKSQFLEGYGITIKLDS
ncbi:MAG: hypothetical protein NDF55_09030 [archaeon GB-1867-005]|nr:hypothetical protein [Candidatus Culexmicrobium cathedralense]